MERAADEENDTFLALDSFVETVGCRAEPIFVVTLRLAVVVVVVDGRSYKVPDQGAYSPIHIKPVPTTSLSISSHWAHMAKKSRKLFKEIGPNWPSASNAAKKATMIGPNLEQGSRHVTPLSVNNALVESRSILQAP